MIAATCETCGVTKPVNDWPGTSCYPCGGTAKGGGFGQGTPDNSCTFCMGGLIRYCPDCADGEGAGEVVAHIPCANFQSGAA